MKIGIVTQSYYPRPGGVTEVAHHTAEALRKRGHRVTIITTSYTGREPDEPGVIRIGRNVLVPVNGAWVNMTIGPGLRRRLERILREEDFDLIQAHCPLVPTLPLMTLETALPHQKIVGTFHAAAERNCAYALFRKPLSRRAERLDCRIAVSEAARIFVNRYFPARYEIVPNGVDCARFNPQVPPIDELRDGCLNVLFVGRLDPRKGVRHLLESIPIAQKRSGRRIRLIMVGESGIRLRWHLRPMNLHGAEIVPVGRVEPAMLPRYYASADIFCSPAVGQESFGIVLLEAMASGVPIIASNIPGYARVVAHGREGLLVPPRDAEAIAQAILDLDSDEAARRELGARGRSKALAYGWPAIVNLLEGIFMRLVGAPEPVRRAEAVRQGT